MWQLGDEGAFEVLVRARELEAAAERSSVERSARSLNGCSIILKRAPSFVGVEVSENRDNPAECLGMANPAGRPASSRVLPAT
jgi:hypothetical protein